MKQSAPKPKDCPVCGKEFTPLRPMQAVCSPRCAVKQAKEKKTEAKKSIKARKEAIKTIPQLISEAQIEFNRYIRARDQHRDCISCGQGLPRDGDIGGAFDAGHYRSRGSASHLRFDERNCHGQCKQCNRWGAGRAVDYRIGLVERIGLENVEALEADNEPHKWTREELIGIKSKYKAKLKELLESRDGKEQRTD